MRTDTCIILKILRLFEITGQPGNLFECRLQGIIVIARCKITGWEQPGLQQWRTAHIQHQVVHLRFGIAGIQFEVAQVTIEARRCDSTLHKAGTTDIGMGCKRRRDFTDHLRRTNHQQPAGGPVRDDTGRFAISCISCD